MATTLNRPAATNTIHQVAHRSAVYVGFIPILALFGSLWFVLRRRPATVPDGVRKGPLTDG